MDMEKLSYIKQPLQCFTTYSRKKTERERERERERKKTKKSYKYFPTIFNGHTMFVFYNHESFL